MILTKLSPLLIKSGKTFCIFFLFFIFFFVLPPISYSQNFPPNPIECNSTADNAEYHSLRPYPFSPCNPNVTGALLCGNTVYVLDSITVGSCCGIGQCCTCDYQIDRSGNVTIDFTNSELPIVGNTEDVTNWDVPTDTLSDIEKVNNYVSWYLNGVIDRAEYSFLSWKDKEDVNKLINFSGPIRKLLPQRIQDDSREKQVDEVLVTRHNQIVACTYGLNIPLTDLQIIAIPGPCKDLGIVGWVFQKKRRILEWEGHLPPKREEFDEFKKYYKEYRRWRGDICLSFEIPFLGGIELMLCFDNPANPNFYGDLYPYIPFTSTEGRVGEAKKEVPTEINMGGANNLILSNIVYDAEDLKLYYAHMQETFELSELLKKTFVPQEGTGGEGETTPVGIGAGCQILDIRTNAGDHLIDPGWSLDKKAITGDLSYTANFSCSFCGPFGTCTVNPVIPISLSTQNPLHDELWHNLVEGADSIFRRIFPKTGSNTPVTAPKDIPGMTTFEASSDTYTIETGGEIYFPHLGGVSEYFLKAIQTALRPKGYGETFDRGKDDNVVKPKCKEDVPDSEVPGKYLGAFKTNFINLANTWSAKCPGPDNNLADECYNYVVTESISKGINPAFALTIWLNESDASNYCHGGPTTQDFGINISSLYQDIVGQLGVFLGMAGNKLCSGVVGFSEPMHGWLSRFQSSAGICDPSDIVATQYYIDVRDNTWSWVTGCSGGGKFGITWPTDSSCP